jgi:hypothetical protein
LVQFGTRRRSKRGRKIGAEQKLFGDISISGSIGKSALGTSNKSVTAGFKRSW